MNKIGICGGGLIGTSWALGFSSNKYKVFVYDSSIKVREKFLNKYHELEIKFKKSEFIYLLVYRFIGGIPWVISCLLPTIFNVRIINFFFATLIGIIPQIFLAVSIGSGIEKFIDDNSEAPGLLELILSSEIYIPLIGFFILVVLSIIGRKIFYKN